MSNYDAGYWDRYYGERSGYFSSPLPSQFATFVMGEAPSGALFLDVGCGNGRDSIFFAKFRHKVIGVDISHIVVSQCLLTSHKAAVDADFIQYDVGAQGLGDRIRSHNFFNDASEVVVYARFFLHAITEQQQAMFLESVRTLADGRSILLAFEYRTDRDRALPKGTDDHYRRYINSSELMFKCQSMGATVKYFVEGFGFAKHKSDDAHVGRVLLSF
jgi:SAM-dependent methyltransferase